MSFNNDLFCKGSTFTSLIDSHSSSVMISGERGMYKYTQENPLNSSNARERLLIDTVSANNINSTGTAEQIVSANNSSNNSDTPSFSIGNISVKTINVNSMFKNDKIHKKHM